MNRILPFAPLLALILIVGVGAFLLLRGEVGGGGREKFTMGMVGRPAPSYALARLGGGEPVASETLSGRAHVVNLFASWCTPCRVEHPQLMALRARGVEIIGVAYKDEAADTARFIAELGDPFSAIGMDPEGRLGLEFGATGAPESYVIGPDGTVRAAYRGPLTPEVVQTVILPALRAE
jgi:cytochrome c biogenesis protein CcmG/thiol:disulfide interchange protein DsbE